MYGSAKEDARSGKIRDGREWSLVPDNRRRGMRKARAGGTKGDFFKNLLCVRGQQKYGRTDATSLLGKSDATNRNDF